MSETLFTSTVLDEEDTNVLIVTNSIDVDFIFSYFEQYLDEDQLESMSNEEDQENILSLIFDYCSLVVDEDILDDNPPTITQCIYVGNTTVVVVEFDQEVLEFLKEEYEETEEVRDIVLGDQEDSEEEDDEEDDEEDEEDEGSDDEWDIK